MFKTLLTGFGYIVINEIKSLDLFNLFPGPRGLIGLLMLIISSIIMIPIILTYLSTHEVPKFPTLILAVSLATTGMLSIAVGLILNTVTRGRHEMKRLFYLSIPNSSKKDI